MRDTQTRSDARLDISASVRSQLPRQLTNKLTEVDAVLGRPVVFFEQGGTPGGAGGKASPEGVVTVDRGRARDLNVLGEEIMHLHRWTRGYPIVQPAALAHQWRYAVGLTQLASHFDEYAFFPFLEGLGLDPRAEVTRAMDSGANALPQQLPQIIRNPTTAVWRVLLSVIYVQAQLLAPSSTARDRLMNLFEDEPLRDFAARGRRLSAEIVGAREESPTEVEQRLVRCVHEILEISTKAALVRRLY